MNIRNKKLNGVIIALIFVAILVATGPLNKVMKRVLNDLSEVTGGHTYLTASFEYLDNKNEKVKNVDDVIYVFLCQNQDFNSGNRVTIKLQANNGQQKVTKIYDQNGNSNINGDINGDYYVRVAVPKNENENINVTDTERFDQNKYKVYENGETYNGSYTIKFPDKVKINENDESNLNIEVKERNGERLSSSEILQPMNLATSFGIFAFKFKLGADVEATVGVKEMETVGQQTFGLSENNYDEGIKKVNKNSKIIVNKIYTKNGQPLSNKQIKIVLLNKDSSIEQEEQCKTDFEGKCKVDFEITNSGNYIVGEKINENSIISNTTITDEQGNDITITFDNQNINMIDFDNSQKITYNYNYVESVSDKENSDHLEKMRLPGTLVLGTDELVKKYSERQEFKNQSNQVILALAGETGYPTINFEEEFDNLKKLSVKLSTAIDSQDVKVYYMKPDDVKNERIDFKSGDKEYILVNVDCGNSLEVSIGQNHTIDGQNVMSNSFEYNDGAKIIYNFYATTNNEILAYSGTVNLKTFGATTGIILAPDAEVDGANGNHSGTIIARDYEHTTGEVHQRVKPKWLDENSTTATITNNLIENDEPKEPEEPDEPDTPQEEEKERNVSIGKVDANKNLIEGAELELRDKDGNVIDSWTSTTELHKIIKELVIGEVYTVHEVKAPEGYQLADDYTFIYNGEENIEYAMVNTKVIINKLDENQSYLPGAELRILDSEGSIVEQWITDDKEHYVNQQLKVGETYTLHEEKAPEGYKIAEDVKFVYEPSNENQVVEMKDQKIVIEVFIEKKNMNDELLSGAHLQVLDSNGNIVDDWVSDNTVHKVNGNLNIGETYTLHEESAPDGYEVSADVSFEVKNTEEPQIITMTDNKIIIPGEPTVVISKKDEENKFLEGATLQILDKDGKVIEEWITNDKEHTVEVKLNIGETYTLHEVLAPTGYKVSDDVEFTVKDTLEVQEVKMIDKRIKKVAGVVETLDKINNYLTIFFVSLSVLLISFIIYSKYNKKKLSK